MWPSYGGSEYRIAGNEQKNFTFLYFKHITLTLFFENPPLRTFFIPISLNNFSPRLSKSKTPCTRTFVNQGSSRNSIKALSNNDIHTRFIRWTPAPHCQGSAEELHLLYFKQFTLILFSANLLFIYPPNRSPSRTSAQGFRRTKHLVRESP